MRSSVAVLPLKFAFAKIPCAKIISENNKWGQSQDQLLKNIFGIVIIFLVDCCGFDFVVVVFSLFVWGFLLLVIFFINFKTHV